jgi:hypothetical protein
VRRTPLALALTLAALGAAFAPPAASAANGPSAANGLPPIRHVFVIVLENESSASTFGPNSPAPYLSKTLPSEGAFVPKYYGVGHASNDNYIAMISAQAPNPQNQADCFSFNDFTPDVISSYGQAVGSGCVFPKDVKTIADQLDAAGLTWRDYNQSMGADPTREPVVCAHPGINQQDHTQSATATDQYATRHNPFVYFHSIIDNTTLCNSHVVNLNLLPQDLSNAASTPNYVFITPDLCGDGHDATCKDPKRPGGYAGIEQFLQQWVPKITSSPAFRLQDGLLAIVFDESATSDTSSCCGEIAGPNSPAPGITGPGGGNTGAVLISPCIKPGTVTTHPYNHYTLLRSVEDLFGVAHLGYAGLPGGSSLGSDVFNRPCAANIKPPVARIGAKLTGSAAHRAIRVSWSANGASAKTFTVQIRQTKPRLHGWQTLVSSGRAGSRVFVRRPGAAYQFRIRVTGVSGLVSSWAKTRSLKLPPRRGRH